MAKLVQQIEYQIERYSLLKHPFYQSWSQGKLTKENLRGYSKEYFQLVKAVPQLVENIASCATEENPKDTISQSLKEENEHIIPWMNFAYALGVPTGELVNYHGDEGITCAVLDLDHITKLSLEEGAAAMYAYEKELPKISRSKIDGLTKFYGLSSKDAVDYFEIHERTDVRHALIWKSMLQHVPKEKEHAVLTAAIRSLRDQNKILDCVQDKYCQKVN
jgi:pyrroloquinoline-quinone synthase